jgi:hypothetical protein
MSRRTVSAGTVGVVVGFFLCSGMAAGVRGADLPPSDDPGFGAEIMRRVDDLFRGRSSHGVLEMEITTTHWERHLALESWSLGTEYSLIRILDPKKERGTATLKAGNDLFTYLSKTGRTIKITSGMMGASWMGSHFTNDDLVRDSRFSEDFDIDLVFEGDEDGSRVYRFALVPHPDTPVVWGSIEVTVRQVDLLPVRQVFFDEDGEAVRSLEYSDYRPLGRRVVPTELVVRPLDDSGEYTRVIWSEIDFDVDLDEGFFTLRKLKSM